MKVTEHFSKAGKTCISFEILPPIKGHSISSIWSILDVLSEFKPPFINVTYHRFEYAYRNTPEGLFKKVYIRKRPGTVGICAAIMNRYGIDAVPHLTCGGFTAEETEDALIDLHYLGINNVLVIRGDPSHIEGSFTPEVGGHVYANELVQQIVGMNSGVYIEKGLTPNFSTDFCIGVAGYPEKHAEAPNFETDLKFLKAKIDAGAGYIVTQMFFDNQKYFDFVKACREIGITQPIIPGLKPLSTLKQLTVLPKTFNLNIPTDLANAVSKCRTDADAREVGIEWCIAQSRELREFGVPSLHYYTMGKVGTIERIVKGL